MRKSTMPRGVATPITQTTSTAYETAETSVLRTPPPDLPSLLLRECIILKLVRQGKEPGQAIACLEDGTWWWTGPKQSFASQET